LFYKKKIGGDPAASYSFRERGRRNKRKNYFEILIEPTEEAAAAAVFILSFA